MPTSVVSLINNDEIMRQAKEVAIKINQCMNNERLSSGEVSSSIIVVAFALHKVRSSDSPFSIDYNSFLSNSEHYNINSDLLNAISHVITEEQWNKLEKLLPQYAADVFAAVAFLPLEQNHRDSLGAFATPPSIIKLSQALLDCRPSDKIADIGCGVGTFFVEQVPSCPNAEYIGCEINTKAVDVARIRSELLSANIKIIHGDAFTVFSDVTLKFDRIFSNYPFGLHLKNFENYAGYKDNLKKRIPNLRPRVSSDWLFNLLLYDLLTENGKAIGIMTNASTWNSSDISMRKYFIENGMIECVISLPSGLLESSYIQTSLIVLSKGNKSVRLIDASQLYHRGRKQNELTSSNIKDILLSKATDNEQSKRVSIDELRKNDYILHLDRYRYAGAKIKDGIPFKEVIKDIKCGTLLRSDELEQLTSTEPTDTLYLKLSNIKNGTITGEPTYLKDCDPKYEKSLVKNNNLLITRNGTLQKIVVAKIKTNQKVLANGNLLVIELDEERANPYYLQAFFASDQGAIAMKSISGGGTISRISARDLEQLIIPLPSMEKQNLIAEKYQALLDEIDVLQLRIEKTNDRILHLFDNGSGD